MTWYTIQVSEHPDAGRRIPTEDAAASWLTVFDGESTAAEAKERVNILGTRHRHCRAFKGKQLGKLWCAVLTMNADQEAADKHGPDLRPCLTDRPRGATA